MYDYPYEPSKVIQSNPQLSKSLQVFQGNSPSFRERIMREMNEEYGKIVDDGDDTQHSVNHDWQNMYPEKKDLSDIPEGSIGGGKKKKSRKKSSQKKRKKSKKRTKRRVKK